MTHPCEHHLCLISFWGLLGDPLSLSPPSCSGPSHLMPDDSIALDDADWEVIADDWWRTPLSLAPYPLSWIDREPKQSRTPRLSEVAARNSHYWHEYLLRIVKDVKGAKVCCASCQEWRYVVGEGIFGCDAMKEVGVQGDQELNLELVGVKMVLALVDQLERAVGITATDHPTGGEIASLARRVSLLLNDAPPIANPEGFWGEYTASVLDGHRIAPHDAVIFRPDLNADPPPADSITSILDLDLDPPRRKSPHFSREVIDLTDSEQSVASEALPVTPKPARSFAAGEGDGTISGMLTAPRSFPYIDAQTFLSSQVIYPNFTFPVFHRLLHSHTRPVPLSPRTSCAQSSPIYEVAPCHPVGIFTKRTMTSSLYPSQRRRRMLRFRISLLRLLTAWSSRSRGLERSLTNCALLLFLVGVRRHQSRAGMVIQARPSRTGEPD
jgi:hypothetical protein